MLVKQLIDILHKEEEMLDALLDSANKKQTALTSNNREMLDDCTHREESLLPQLQAYERQRSLAMDKIKMEHGITDNSKKLESLISNLEHLIDNSILEKIGTAHTRIKNKVQGITKMNEQNLFLINQSRRFINDTINTLINKNDKAILDKKV